MKKFKKGAADLIAIVVSVVVVGALAIGVMTLLSTTTKTSTSNAMKKLDTDITAAMSKVAKPSNE